MDAATDAGGGVAADALDHHSRTEPLDPRSLGSDAVAEEDDGAIRDRFTFELPGPLGVGDLAANALVRLAEDHGVTVIVSSGLAMIEGEPPVTE
jgi:hypothetical protein